MVQSGRLEYFTTLFVRPMTDRMDTIFCWPSPKLRHFFCRIAQNLDKSRHFTVQTFSMTGPRQDQFCCLERQPKTR